MSAESGSSNQESPKVNQEDENNQSTSSEVFKEDENKEKNDEKHGEEEESSDNNSSVSLNESEDSDPQEEAKNVSKIGESLIRETDEDKEDFDSEEGLFPDNRTKFVETEDQPMILHPLKVRGEVTAEINSAFPQQQKSSACLLF